MTEEKFWDQSKARKKKFQPRNPPRSDPSYDSPNHLDFYTTKSRQKSLDTTSTG